MIDFVPVFGKSFKGLLSHRKSLCFIASGIILQYVLLFVLLGVTGGFGLVSELQSERSSFAQNLSVEAAANTSDSFAAIAATDDQYVTRQFFNKIVDDGTFSDLLKSYITPFTVIASIIFAILSILVQLFATTLALYSFTPLSKKNWIAFSTFFWRNLGIILYNGIVGCLLPFIALLIIIALIALLMSSVSPFFGLLFIIVVPAFVVGIVYIGVRIFFIPYSFIAQRKLIRDAIADSFALSKKYFWAIFLVILISGAIEFLINAGLNQAIDSSSVFFSLDSGSVGVVILAIVLLLVTVAINSLTRLFTLLFAYNGYFAVRAQRK